MSWIEGLKVKVTSEELKELLELNAGQHEDRADYYARRYKADSDAIADEEDAQAYSNSARKQLKTSEQQHRDKATYYRFIGNHLMEGDYHLTQNDLVAIGITDRGW